MITKRFSAAFLSVAIGAAIFVLAGPTQWAEAHRKDLSIVCGSWSAEVIDYSAGVTNTITTTVDGGTPTVATFIGSYTEGGSIDGNVGHVVTVQVAAPDDPTGSKGWSFTRILAIDACIAPTTTANPPTSTPPTTAPPTSTPPTTVPPTTAPPTTAPPTSATTTTAPPTVASCSTCASSANTAAVDATCTSTTASNDSDCTAVLPDTGTRAADLTPWALGFVLLGGALTFLGRRRHLSVNRPTKHN